MKTLDTKTLKLMIDCAIQTKKQIRISYVDEEGRDTQRYVEPIKWLGGDGILTHCHVRENFRHFKLHRIYGIAITDYDFEWVNGRAV